MKARLLWLPLLIGIVVVLSGCPGLFGDPGGDDDGDDEPADTTSPTEVTDLQVARSSGTVALVWTDPTDEDLAGIEVTWEPDGSEVQAVDPGVGEYVADDLTNGTEYTFTVAAVDESGNLSAGETVTVTPA
ncbi:MAG: fibronectin type III domain-containing protein, partial [bacterium]